MHMKETWLALLMHYLRELTFKQNGFASFSKKDCGAELPGIINPRLKFVSMGSWTQDLSNAIEPTNQLS
jgi:hypothetical protein